MSIHRLGCVSWTIACTRWNKNIYTLSSRRMTMGPQAVARGVKDQQEMAASNTNSNVRIAQTFYRRTGNRMLNSSFRRNLSTPVDSEILSMFFPALIALVLEPLQASVEAVIVGHLGVAPLGAVGVGTVIFQFVLGLFGTFIFATTPVVAQMMGFDEVEGGGRKQASILTANGVWIAVAVGMVLQIAVSFYLEPIVGFVSSDQTVASLAVAYLSARSWAFAPALMMMVAIGASRGYKDMQAPLIGSLAYGVGLVVLDPFFVYYLGQGVEGAGWGAAISQIIGAVAIFGVLTFKGEFDPRDLLRLPPVSGALRYAQMAPSLALNSLAALAPALFATSLATDLGPEHLAAHTVLRQLTWFYLQTFLAFNVTAHSMIASQLGSSRRSSGMGRAAEILERICQLAIILSIPLGLVLFYSRGSLPSLFTSDAEVESEVAAVLPFLLLYMPLDALGLSLEGGILGAADTQWIAKRTAASSALSLTALTLAGTHQKGLVTIWICSKILNLAALGFDLGRFLRPVARTTVGSRTIDK